MSAVEERFWAKVNKSGDCWLWTASTRGNGYGQCTVGRGKQGYAHRYSYELANGPVPDGMELDHVCHNRLCVRPDHLRVTTRKQNTENLSGAYSNSKSGIRGVWWVARLGKWKATVVHNGTAEHVGWHSTAEDAEAAVIARRNELFTHNELDRRTT